MDVKNFDPNLFDRFKFKPEAVPEAPRPFNPDESPQVLRYLNQPMDQQSSRIIKLWREVPKTFVIDHFDVILDDWQEEALEHYMVHERLGLIASKGPGKAQPLDLKIVTPKGEVKFGSLKVGDPVFAGDGTVTKVTGVFPQGVKQNYRVTFDDGTSTECCDEHLWKVRGVDEKRKGTWSVLSLREIMNKGIKKMQGKQEYYPWQLPKQEPLDIPKREDLPISPYVLGLWIGDGTRRKGQITTMDQETINDLIINYGYEVKVEPQKSKAFSVNIKGLKVKLRELGVEECYSYEKHIPSKYLMSGYEQRLELLQGLMDSDGTCGETAAKGVEYYTTSEKLAEDVAWLVRSLGGKSNIKTKKSMFKGQEYRISYRVRVSMPVCPFRLSRKVSRWYAPSQDRYLSRTIKNVEYIGAVPMMCISVEHEDRTYMTNDLIITHNTAFLSWAGLHFLTMYYETKLAALSITKDHLKDNLWSELLKWRSRSEVLKKTISAGSEKIEVFGKEGIAFISARSFAKGANEADMQSSLAGLHADNVGFLIDEAGMMPDSLFTTADAALANADQEGVQTGKMPKRARILVVANPERPSGLIYRAFNGDPAVAHLWKIMNITSDPDNPKRTKRVTKQWAQSVIDLFGRDHPYTKINVFGEYPDSTTDMLLSEKEIDEAMSREYTPDALRFKQKRLGIDVARGGSDSTILALRQGLKVEPLQIVSSSENGFQVGARALDIAERTGVRRTYVDGTGGYGSSVIDFLKTEGSLDVIPVVYNAKASRPEQFNNKRTEMWVRFRDWVRNGGSLPKDEYLKKELLAPLLFFNGTQFKLESKEDIRKRIGRSPDRADAIAQTFYDTESLADQDASLAKEDPIMERFLANTKERYYSDSSQIDDYYIRMHNNYKS